MNEQKLKEMLIGAGGAIRTRELQRFRFFTHILYNKKSREKK